MKGLIAACIVSVTAVLWAAAVDIRNELSAMTQAVKQLPVDCSTRESFE